MRDAFDGGTAVVVGPGSAAFATCTHGRGAACDAFAPTWLPMTVRALFNVGCAHATRRPVGGRA
jgi:hypothetical protein